MRAFIFQTSENFPNSGTLIIEYNVAESAAANGIVTIQERAMLPINFTRFDLCVSAHSGNKTKDITIQRLMTSGTFTREIHINQLI